MSVNVPNYYQLDQLGGHTRGVNVPHTKADTQLVAFFFQRCELFGEVLDHVVTLWFTVDEDVEAQPFLLGDHQLDLIDHEQGRPANTNR